MFRTYRTQGALRVAAETIATDGAAPGSEHLAAEMWPALREAASDYRLSALWHSLWIGTFCSELRKARGDSIEEGIKPEFEDLVARKRHPSLEEASEIRVRCAEHFLDVSADVLA